jgi:hypothetical protein
MKIFTFGHATADALPRRLDIGSWWNPISWLTSSDDAATKAAKKDVDDAKKQLHDANQKLHDAKVAQKQQADAKKAAKKAAKPSKPAKASSKDDGSSLANVTRGQVQDDQQKSAEANVKSVLSQQAYDKAHGQASTVRLGPAGEAIAEQLKSQSSGIGLAYDNLGRAHIIDRRRRTNRL